MLVDVVDGHWCQVWKNKTIKLSLSSVNLCSNGNLESNKTDVEEWRRIRKGTPSGLQSRRWELNQQTTPLTSWRCRSSAPHHLCRCGPRAFAVAALSDHVQFFLVFFCISNLSPVPEDPSLSSRCFLISLVQTTSCLHPPHVAAGTLFLERWFDLAPSAGHVLHTRPGAPSQQQTLSLFQPEWLHKSHLTSSVRPCPSYISTVPLVLPNCWLPTICTLSAYTSALHFILCPLTASVGPTS